MLGGSHLRALCRRLRGLGKLDLFEPLRQLARVGQLLALEQQSLQARTQRLTFGQVDPGLQRLQHALHCPLLPLVEGHVVDLEFPADFRRSAPFGPHPQDGLGFLLGGIGRRG